MDKPAALLHTGESNVSVYDCSCMQNVQLVFYDIRLAKCVHRVEALNTEYAYRQTLVSQTRSQRYF